MQVDWELSQSLTSDGQGIRSVGSLPAIADNEVDAGAVVTGTQGGALYQFGLPSGTLQPIAYQHDHSVTAILTGTSDEYYVTGCKDARIRIFQAHQLVATLEGHEKPVTSLAWAASSSSDETFFVSGSWDGTAKVWNLKTRALVATLEGHENAVCVTALLLPTDHNNNVLRLATGSAGIAQGNVIVGHCVRFWTVNTTTGQVTKEGQTKSDHEGPIRDILCFGSESNELTLATCSNDGTVKLRSIETGECTSTLTFAATQQQQQQPPMLLSLCYVQGCLVASAEDGHVIVWDLQQPQPQPQIILHPSCVWQVRAVLDGQDFATACDDGTVRIFTRATERFAPAAEREAFDQQVQAAHTKASSKGGGPSPEEVAKLPLWERNLEKRGTSEGQVQLFQKNGIAIAAQWSAASQTWIEVGQVMGSAGGDDNVIDGVTYDHVLPIEVDTPASSGGGGGVASLQIGYNNGENPFVAAQRFIDAHMLPQYHLTEIADYIQQRTGQASQTPTIGMDTTSTTASRTTPVPTTGVPMASYTYLPIQAHQTFDLAANKAAATLEKMKTKLESFGKLSEPQLGHLASLLQTLGETNRYHASKIADAELQLVSDMLDQFPPAEAFPALDLARLLALHSDATSKARFAFWDRLLQQAVSLCRKAASSEVTGPSAVALPMLSLRLFANCFKGEGPGIKEAVEPFVETILSCAELHVKSTNKNIRLSVATLLHNVCFYLTSPQYKGGDESVLVGAVPKLVPLLNEVLSNRTYEETAIQRTLLALGTLVMSSKVAKDAANGLYLASKVEMSASPFSASVKATAKEVYNVLQ